MTSHLLRAFRRLPTRPTPLLAATLMHSETAHTANFQRHARHWSTDGTVVLQCAPGSTVYKLSADDLSDKSPSYPWSGDGDIVVKEEYEGAPLLRIPSALGISPTDLEILLDCLGSDP